MRLYLEGKYFQMRSGDSFTAYRKHKKLLQKIYKKEKVFFRNLNLPIVTDNKNYFDYIVTT